MSKPSEWLVTAVIPVGEDIPVDWIRIQSALIGPTYSIERRGQDIRYITKGQPDLVDDGNVTYCTLLQYILTSRPVSPWKVQLVEIPAPISQVDYQPLRM